jgi:MFS family permease
MNQTEAALVRRPPLATRLFNEHGPLASLSLGQFRLVLAGTAASQVAGWMDTVARGWLVNELTHSAFQLGLLAFIYGIASLVASPIAGYITDRVERRALASGTQLMSAGLALTIGLLVASGQIAMWHLYITAGLQGVVFAVNMPARQVLVYDVVGSERLTNAIALNAVMANVARIAAPSIGGAIIAAIDIEAAFYAQAAFFFLATIVTFLLRPITLAKPVRVPVWQGLREGFDYVRGDPVMSRLVLLNVVPNVLIYPYVSLFPIFAEDVLSVGSTGYGVLLSAVGFGSIPGGLIVAGMSQSKAKGRTMGAAALLYMGLVAAFATSSVFVLSFSILVVAGLGWSMMAILNQTLLQLQLSDDAMRGRVLAFYTMASGLTPIGNLSMGSAADVWGVQRAVAAFAIAGFALAAYLGLGSKRMREL